MSVMMSHDNYEITGQISGQIISDLPIQHSKDLALGIQHELGLFVLAQESNLKTQVFAQKSIEILLDDMSFNLSALSDKQKQSSTHVSNCLHESVENINDYLIEQHQINPDNISQQGISLSAIQCHSHGISSCLHGNISCLKYSNDTLYALGSKLTKTKALGVNSRLSFTVIEEEFKLGDILFLATFELIEQLGHEFIRITLSRFGDNLYMAIRQINSRAKKKGITSNLSFIVCKNNSHTSVKKGWLSQFS